MKGVNSRCIGMNRKPGPKKNRTPISLWLAYVVRKLKSFQDELEEMEASELEEMAASGTTQIMPIATNADVSCSDREPESDKEQSQSTSENADDSMAGHYTPPAGCALGKYFKDLELAVSMSNRV